MNESSLSNLGPGRISKTTNTAFHSTFKQPFINDEDMPRKDEHIDNEIIVQRYRDLRRQQKEFLMKANLSTKLKREIFGLGDSRDVKKSDSTQKLVTLIDPFKGRLIMKQKDWIVIEKQKEREMLGEEKQFYRVERQRERIKRKEEEERIEKEEEEQIKKQEEICLNQSQKQSQKNGQKKILNIFSLLPGMDKKAHKQKKDKQAKPESIPPRKSITENQKPPFPTTEKKLSSIAEQANRDKNQMASCQYNIKIQKSNIENNETVVVVTKGGENLIPASENMKNKRKWMKNVKEERGTSEISGGEGGRGERKSIYKQFNNLISNREKGESEWSEEVLQSNRNSVQPSLLNKGK